MNFNDFSKFFTQFLLKEAENDIENRRFQNEAPLNFTENYEDDFNNKNATIANRKISEPSPNNLPKTLPKNSKNFFEKNENNTNTNDKIFFIFFPQWHDFKT